MCEKTTKNLVKNMFFRATTVPHIIAHCEKTSFLEKTGFLEKLGFLKKNGVFEKTRFFKNLVFQKTGFLSAGALPMVPGG